MNPKISKKELQYISILATPEKLPHNFDIFIDEVSVYTSQLRCRLQVSCCLISGFVLE
jgi:hypothetical protein